ncbi:hypothetical protein OAA27_01035 [bacterium]|nr:hypothetical protein [bacterium]
MGFLSDPDNPKENHGGGSFRKSLNGLAKSMLNPQGNDSSRL